MKITGTAILLTALLITVPQEASTGKIHEAAKGGDIHTVSDLIQNGADINENLDGYGATALHWAAVKGHRDLAEFLIGKGAIVDKKNKDGDTALHLAVAFGRIEIVKLLLANGAKIEERRKEGTTPLYISVGRKQIEITKLLIASGADIDDRNLDGVTPLYHVAAKNLIDMVALLISNGADPNAPNKHGDTPLHVAAAYGNKKIVEFLLSKGANSLIKSYNGSTPAHFARKQGYSDIAQLLEAVPTFTTHINNAHQFSIKYPNHWNVLTSSQIKSMTDGMSGSLPVFAAQSQKGENLFVIAGSTTPHIKKIFAENAEIGLHQQYSEFTGTTPTDWICISESIRDVNGKKALFVEWKMPPIQGVVMIQKHMCLIVSEKVFFISATSDIGSWENSDNKWFRPCFDSFQTITSGFTYTKDTISGNIVFGMQASKAAKVLGDGLLPVTDTSYEPIVVAKFLLSKGLRLEFLHDRLYSITLDTKFDLF